MTVNQSMLHDSVGVYSNVTYEIPGVKTAAY